MRTTKHVVFFMLLALALSTPRAYAFTHISWDDTSQSFNWADDLSPSSTSVVTVRAQHFDEIKQAIDLVTDSLCGGLTSIEWETDSVNHYTDANSANITVGRPVRAATISALRNAIRNLYNAGGITSAIQAGLDPNNTVWDGDITAGDIIKKEHIHDMRLALNRLATSCSCNFTPYADQGCGLGGCTASQMYQTRTAALPSCTPLSQCNDNSSSCTTGTCTDGILNQGETLTDCGGPCASCCGNGRIDASLGESCDFGTALNGVCPSACSSSCQTQSCFACSGLSAAFSGFGPNIILPFYTQAQIWNWCATSTSWSIRPAFQQDADAWVQGTATASELAAYRAAHDWFFMPLAPISTKLPFFGTPASYQSSGSSGNLSWTFRYQDPDITDLLRCVANIQLCETVPSCTNGIQDGGEGGVDCGGSCPSVCCGNGRPDPGEGCDNGSVNNGACPRPCSASCQPNGDCVGCWDLSYHTYETDYPCRNSHSATCPPGPLNIQGISCNSPGLGCTVHNCRNGTNGTFGEDIYSWQCNGSLC